MSLATPVDGVVGRWPRMAAAMRSRPLTTSLAMGALTALAFPPVYFLPGILGFAALLALVVDSPGWRRALGLGWCFGFAHMLVGLYWVAIAFFNGPEAFRPLAVPAVLGLCAGLAFFPAAACAVIRLREWRSLEAAALAFALLWSAGEIARGQVFDFPWNLVGYVWTLSDATMQAASVIGVGGLSLVTVALAALPAGLLLGRPSGRRWLAVAVVVPALVWAGGTARLATAGADDVDGVRLRLVQANVAQHHKWDPDKRERWFRRHLSLTSGEADGVTHVVWPESATPFAIEDQPAVRQMIAAAAPPGGLVLTGGEVFEWEAEVPHVHNSLFAVDPAGEVRARYDKVDLVPFGEYMPLRYLLGRIGLSKLTEGSLDFAPGPGRRTLALDGLPPFSPLICYEVIFSGRVASEAPRAGWLLNITNDAWFGTSSGPFQHLAMARTRAVEEGLPLVRAANTGISAVVDPYGRIRASLGLGETGVLDSSLPRQLEAPTWFARAGLPIQAGLALSLVVIVIAAELRGRQQT